MYVLYPTNIVDHYFKSTHNYMVGWFAAVWCAKEKERVCVREIERRTGVLVTENH